MLLCTHCRSLYTADIPAPDDAPDHDQIYTTVETTIIPDFIQRRVREIVSSFSNYRQSNRFLDLGFGSAVFMKAAATKGWEVSGVEVSRSAVENARGSGFQNVFHGNLAGAGFPAAHFDVVVASEVLEHLVDVRSLLKEVVRILRPGGLFWASTPHARGLSFRLLQLEWSVVCPPHHLQLFSVAGMRTLLQTAGFQQISFATHGFNPYEVLHARHRTDATPDFNRVATSRQLNERLMRTPVRRAGKQALNAVLNATRLGDRMKIHAVHPPSGKSPNVT